MIYIISDIHGNIDALEKFFDSIKIQSKDKIYALGDYVGYYYYPNECLNLLRKYKVNCIKGNHDINLIKSIKNKKLLKEFCKKYGNSYEETVKKITIKNLNFLKNMKKNMKIIFSDYKVLLSHGAPWKNDCYIYPNVDRKTLNKFLDYDYDIFFVGHTHRKYTHKHKKKIIYNPGSVGQPRDGNKGINWIEFDPKYKSISFKNRRYNTSKIKQEIKIKDEEKYHKLVKYL